VSDRGKFERKYIGETFQDTHTHTHTHTNAYEVIAEV